MRPAFVLLCILLSLCTCDSAQNPLVRDHASATVRFIAGDELLSTNIQVESAKAGAVAAVPKVFGFAMDSVSRGGATTFLLRKKMKYPALIPLTIPCRDQTCEVDVKISPVFVDSFPNVIKRSEDLRVAYGEGALTSQESLIFFFEPTAGGQPNKIKLVGPTNGPVATLPTDALVEIPPGSYEIYLIKQQTRRDTSDQLIARLQGEYITRSRLVTLAE